MILQLVDIFYPNVFKRYSEKYSIFRDLYEKDLLGLEIRDINPKLARRVKKIILSNKEICYTNQSANSESEDLLALGSYGIFKELSKEIIAIGNEDLGFKVSKLIQNITEYENRNFQIGENIFPNVKAAVMGILNVTPDSFSDGGKYFDQHAAVKHGLSLLEEGADILDIGGESSRPGAEPISEKEELNRVIPVINAILNARPDALISIDTTKANVADEALSAGAKIINDISSFSNDQNILKIAKKYQAGYIIMHMLGNPKTMQNNPVYEDIISEIYDFLINKIEVAKSFGVLNLFVDPGIGFGKSVKDNYEILKRLNEFKGIGYPVLVGLSNKSFLGNSLNLEIDNRAEATLTAETLAIKNGARIIRTHNVRQAILAAKINSLTENPDQLKNV